mmetsp:Transcript_38442/g.81940  ORF Transcript_38442/g.81940 Transcript_38442/m.81940 type:complete len:211 (+) Transcript_38442:41-673(+)
MPSASSPPPSPPRPPPSWRQSSSCRSAASQPSPSSPSSPIRRHPTSAARSLVGSTHCRNCAKPSATRATAGSSPTASPTARPSRCPALPSSWPADSWRPSLPSSRALSTASRQKPRASSAREPIGTGGPRPDRALSADGSQARLASHFRTCGRFHYPALRPGPIPATGPSGHATHSKAARFFDAWDSPYIYRVGGRIGVYVERRLQGVCV